MKISFDFDSCLAEERMQKLAKKFIENGDEVWITTSRMKDVKGRLSHNTPVFVVANNLGIPHSRIQFTEGADKHIMLDGFDIHFDDDIVEIEEIEYHELDCVGVLILDE